MKTVARIVTRMQGEGDGLFLGTLLKGAKDFLEPNSVYELLEFNGAVTLRKVGEAIVAGTGQTVRDSPLGLRWGTEVGQILSVGGPYLFLSKEEVKNLR